MSKESPNDHKDTGIGTGSTSAKEYVTINYPFEKYEIIVKLTMDGRFVGIEEVRINKDFRSYKQSIPQKIFRDIDEYKPE
jgi:hypothetical protein